jgi:hypothetical protein
LYRVSLRWCRALKVKSPYLYKIDLLYRVSLRRCRALKVKSPYLYKIDLLYRVSLRRWRAQLLFSVKPAVCCCVYLKSRELT